MAIGLSNSTFTAPRTVFDLIVGAYQVAKILGDGEPLAQVVANKAGYRLNDIIQQASIEKLFASYETDIQIPLQPFKSEYTIGGAGSDVTAARPVEIIAGYVRRQGIDYPVAVSHSKIDYDGLRNKGEQSGGWPSFVYYQAAFPDGKLYLYPTPSDSASTLTLTINAEIAPYSALSDLVLLPPTYYAWLEYKLASRLAPDYGQIWSVENQTILDNIEGALIRNNIKPAPRIGVEVVRLSSSESRGHYETRSDRGIW